MSTPEIYKIQSDVTSLQKDMTQVNTIVDKLDLTIQKLTDVSSNVSRLLAVHETRLETQEKAGSQLALLIEKNKEQIDVELNSINNKIGATEKELRDEIDARNEEVLTKLGALSKDLQTLQRWMWLVSGGGAVIGFLLANFIKWLPIAATIGVNSN